MDYFRQHELYLCRVDAGQKIAFFTFHSMGDPYELRQLAESEIKKSNGQFNNFVILDPKQKQAIYKF